MRTVTFSDSNVQSLLDSDFVCTYTNTKGDPSAGASFSHSINDQPGPCGPRAGRQNVQLVFMNSQGNMFHVACGYLSPKDMQSEIRFASDLYGTIKLKSKNASQSVADSHYDRLRKLDYTKQEIEESVSQFGDSITSFSPQDLDLQFPQLSMPKLKMPKMNLPNANLPQTNFDPNLISTALENVSHYRVLRDHKFMIDNPMISRKDFDKSPQNLLGDQKSFFGSNAAMQRASDMSKSQFGFDR